MRRPVGTHAFLTKWRLIAAALALLGTGPTPASAQTRDDPDTWILWRCGPIPFPNEIRPAVPELADRPPVDLGRFGEDLRVVVPDVEGPLSRDQKALRRSAELIVDKARRGKVVAASRLDNQDRARTLFVLGTRKDNPVIRELLKGDAAAINADLKPSGYAIKPFASPFAAGKMCVVAVGADPAGAWAAALILAFSLHPEREGLTALRQWPVDLPPGTYWLPFEARYTLDPDAYEIKPRAAAPPPRPRVPFGVRIWGSPMPTLESYQRVIRALAKTGINTVVVQSGGWVDLPNAADVFVKALDIAWQEGLYTILYAGNEEAAHLPAPLSPAHRAAVLATRDHPGLLGWHLYNQLAATLTPEQRELVRAQIAWLRSVSAKPIGNEVVWGHNLVAIPEDKQRLIRDLKAWGNDDIATDYAPIGGWARKPILSRWEDRLRELARLDVKKEAVLQAHVPFLDPTVPRREELRNQYWWAAAGGAEGFYIETAYLFTHFSIRGVLGWNGAPLPDGRYDEIRELAAVTRKLEPVLIDAVALDEAQARETQVTLVPSRQLVALRLRRGEDGTLYALLINQALDAEASVRLTVASPDVAYEVIDLLQGMNRGRLDRQRQMHVQIPAGSGMVYALHKDTP